ncbi:MULTISPECIES: type VII secretion target [Rhodococcus]|uniref:Type VII secretion target n=1 Tax=Rhodococcus oxybenzonivorans TaxID=1990687 RepID=A0AAE4UYV2_9NOCA|nr:MULTISPECIES: type VII secretion target [Rhodococcus]MDV7242733.1 type VII secretion target [Rhodococcus oxybenzonivorans]MDV7265620.1 type VII secretion target [Rhodococcus oxybenzonivorans]MDV7276166.1 type VII secretion target [Rhodococcus oxybenzonivorans]MDV7332221.1 type VII secretion target [Rhodococcus oxybenzonivorans]MDV7344426.1 type VII secretion target [Rhodococcus oxybenzonivorans]
MSDVFVVTDGIRRYGATAAQAAEQISSAAAIDLAADLAALAPVFGPIGADFLASFAVAQGNHAKSVAELASHYAHTAVASGATADSYDSVDDANGGALGDIGGAIGDLA